jgi:hypothetical protein
VRSLMALKSSKRYIFWVCVCVQHAMHIGNIVICVLSGYTNFVTLFHKQYDLKKKKKRYCTQNECLDFLYKFCLNISHSKRTERDMIKNLYFISLKVTISPVRL